MSIQGYSGLFSVSKASLIDTEHRLLEQIKLAGTRCFLKGTLTSIHVISSVMIGKKSPQNFFICSCLFFFGRREDEGMLQGWVSRGTIICQLGLKYPQLIWHFPSAWATQRDSEENEREMEKMTPSEGERVCAGQDIAWQKVSEETHLGGDGGGWSL